MAGGVLVYAEVRDGEVAKVAREALTAGRGLAASLGGELSAVVAAPGAAELAEGLGKFGARTVYAAGDEQLAPYTVLPHARAVTAAMEKAQPRVVLFSASVIGRDLAPRVSARAGAPLASDCIELAMEDGSDLKALRPIYAGKVRARVKLTGDGPLLATLRPNVVTPSEADAGSPAVESLAVNFPPEDLRAVVKDVVKGAGEKVDLTEASIVVSGGRSLASAENFKIIEDLASVLGAAVGASRAAVDAGYAPHSMQVGQTGKTVNPTLYIACGISGAVQHLAGMRTSRYIVAINKDPDAPIFKLADYGIVGDLFEVVPLLTEEFKKALE